MKKIELLVLKVLSVDSAKEALLFLKNNGIVVLAQYDIYAFELSITDEEETLITNSGLFSELYAEVIPESAFAGKPEELTAIFRDWNYKQEKLTRTRDLGVIQETRSWGDANYEEPLPFSEISIERLLEVVDLNKTDSAVRDLNVNDPDLEKTLAQRYDDPTLAYHVARLIARHPEYKEAILTLDKAVLQQVLVEKKSDSAARGLEFGPEETCWRMNGEISVGVIFVESSQPGGPVFSATEKTTLRSEITDGLNWLSTEHPTGNLTWVFNFQNTSINVANGTNSSTEDYWRNPAMRQVNFNGTTFTGDWAGLVSYRNAMRTANDSAHAIVILVTPYGTKWHAYASDARLTLANRNDWGGWGISVIDIITAHETCHLFGAADEYSGAGTPCSSCTTLHGCDRVPNGNCRSCATPGEDCVMDRNAKKICSFTRRQIGWLTISPVVANFGYDAGGWRVDRHPRFVVDVTGDGRPDIVGFGNAGVWVSRNNGNGTFQNPFLSVANFGYDAGGWRVDQHPRMLADVTGDGRPDIVGFGHAGAYVSRNNGGGSFLNPTLVVGNFGSGAGGWRVDRHPRFMADVTGDGRADIVGFGNAGAWVSRNNGDGTFQNPTLVVANFGYDAGGWRVENHPRFVVDVTGDGRADIIGFGGAGVWLSRNNGNGTFQNPTLVVGNFGYDQGWRVDKHPRFLADVTGDGRPDIVGFGAAGVWISRNNGNGTFQAPFLAVANFGYDAGGWRVDQHPRLVGDVTGDGRQDIVGFGDAGVWISRNNGNGTFQNPTLAVSNFGYTAGGWRVDKHPRVLADVNGDGKQDIVGFGDAGVWVWKSDI